MSASDAFSLVSSFLWLAQPGVDREAVYRWTLGSVFGTEEVAARWGVFVAHKTFEWGMLALFGFLYYCQFPLIERHKVMPLVPWPWNSKKPGAREKSLALIRKSLIYIAKFHFCVMLINAFVAKPLEPHRTSPDALPSRWTVVWHALVGTVIAEVGFYWGHRAMHTKLLYGVAHKKHHEFAQDTTVFATMYVTWIECLLADIIPVGISVVMFDMHLYEIWVFTLAQQMNAFVVHCGYAFPSPFNPLVLIPFATESEITHDVHHRNRDFNFGGSSFLCDYIFGTYRDPLGPDGLRHAVVPAEDRDLAKSLFAGASDRVKPAGLTPDEALASANGGSGKPAKSLAGKSKAA